MIYLFSKLEPQINQYKLTHHMLPASFFFMKGMNYSKEKELWNAGFRQWDDVLDRHEELGKIQSLKHHEIKTLIAEVKQAKELLIAKNFNQLRINLEMKSFKAVIRLIDSIEKIAFIDIETTGLNILQDIITTIALYDGKSLKTYVQGKNLDQFAIDIKGYEALVAFNGNRFDFPWLERFLKIETSDYLLLDMLQISRHYGWKGGLKDIERQLDIGYKPLKELNGSHAPILWKMYKFQENKQALETLLVYNSSDVLILEHLLNMAANKYIEENQIPIPFKEIKVDPFELLKDFKVDEQIVKRVLSREIK